MVGVLAVTALVLACNSTNTDCPEAEPSCYVCSSGPCPGVMGAGVEGDAGDAGTDAGDADSSTSDGSQSCAERTADARDALLAAASQALAADVSCTSDSDCTLASDNSTCGDGYGCGIVVNQAGAAALQAAIAQVNAITCAGFLADGCQPPIALPCAPLLPSCVAGACSDFPVPPSDDAGDAASDGASE
jgi:hypothetical protein